MYDGWEAQRWETPVSDVKSLALVSLVDDGNLQITLEELRNPERPRWRFVFEAAPIYQNILEEYRLGFWKADDAETPRLGWTLTVPNSPWLAKLRDQESLLDIHSPGLRHFLVGTEDDVIDILSAEPPLIESISPGTDADPVPGKSEILYAGEDKDRVREVFVASAKKD